MKVFVSQSAKAADPKQSALKDKLKEAQAELKTAKSNYTKAERALTAADNAVTKAEAAVVKAEKALGMDNQRIGAVKLPVVGQVYVVKEFKSPPGVLVKPGAKGPAKVWVDRGVYTVTEVLKSKIRVAGLASGTVEFATKDVGVTVKFVKATADQIKNAKKI